MIKIYSGIKGFAVLLFLMAGIVLLFSVFFWGIAKAAQLLLPLLTVISYFLIAVFLIGILPASFFPHLRSRLAVYTVLMSHVLGASSWMMAFFFIIKSFGAGAVFLALMFQFLAPVAIVGAMFKGAWVTAGHLTVWIVFSYGMKFYGQWLLGLGLPQQEKKDIIDVEAVEVSESGS